MGYVHDTRMTHFIHPHECLISAGTWTDTVASNVWARTRSAADAAFTIQIPVLIPQNSGTLKGSRLKSVDIFYKVSTAAMDAVAATLYLCTLPADGAAHSAASVTTTYDTGHDTAAERIDADEHKMTLTLSTAAWLDDDDYYYVELVCDAAGTSVFDFYGARANFDFRV